MAYLKLDSIPAQQTIQAQKALQIISKQSRNKEISIPNKELSYFKDYNFVSR